MKSPKPENKSGAISRHFPARTVNHASRKLSASSLLIGIAVFVFAGHAFSQPAVQPTPPPAPQSSDAQEQRRVQERDQVLREQQERGPDVRLPKIAEAEAGRLPSVESTCFVIHQLTLKSAASDKTTSTYPFAWSLDAAAGPDQSDSPLERCLGAEGVGIVIKRLQNAVIAGGYVTTRILAEPQDLQSGVLALTVIPGRIHAIRFAQGSGARGNAWNAVPAKPGDILNLRDIEQSLENFKRVPTAEADI